MNKSGTKTGLFLMELVIALLLFAFCAAICMQLFVAARGRTSDSDNLSQSVYIVTSAAECYKNSGGDLEAVQELLGGYLLRNPDDMLIVNYNGDWKEAPETEMESWLFALVITKTSDGAAKIKVSKIRQFDPDESIVVVLEDTTNVIYSITVKAVGVDA